MSFDSKTSGWSWKAFFLGPFWYLSKGMNVKGFWLITLTLISCLLAAPFVWVYCGARGVGDWYDFRMKEKSRVDLSTL